MPAIIFEGPDGSGKTTLAEALYGSLPGGAVEYVKSPAGRSASWSGSWHNWALNHAEVPGKIYLLDRTPEISEPIYAAAQGRLPRTSRSFKALDDIISSLDVFLIVARPQSNPSGRHYDPMGQAIDHDKVRLLYFGLETHIATYAPMPGGNVVTYQYWNPNSVKELLWNLRTWANGRRVPRPSLGFEKVMEESVRGRMLMAPSIT